MFKQLSILLIVFVFGCTSLHSLQHEEAHEVAHEVAHEKRRRPGWDRGSFQIWSASDRYVAAQWPTDSNGWKWLERVYTVPQGYTSKFRLKDRKLWDQTLQYVVLPNSIIKSDGWDWAFLGGRDYVGKNSGRYFGYFSVQPCPGRNGFQRFKCTQDQNGFKSVSYLAENTDQWMIFVGENKMRGSSFNSCFKLK